MFNPHKCKRLLEMWTSEWSMVSLICMRIIIHFIYAYTFIYLFICWSLTFTPCNFSSFFVRIPFIKCSKKKKSESLKTFIRSAFRANDSAKRRYACTRYFNNGIRIRCWDCRWNWIVRKVVREKYRKIYIFMCWSQVLLVLELLLLFWWNRAHKCTHTGAQSFAIAIP